MDSTRVRKRIQSSHKSIRTIKRKAVSTDSSPLRKKHPGCFNIGNSYGTLSAVKHNADRRQQLLQGTTLSCVQRPGAACGTVVLRGETVIKIPLEAHFEDIWVHCYLLSSNRHPNMCGPEELIKEGDPAQRLGISYQYKHRISLTRHQQWVKVNTGWQIQQMNTLVDYLEGRDLQHSKDRPRRVIPKKDKQFTVPQVQ